MQNTILKLLQIYENETALAVMANTSQPTISRLKNGGNPSWKVGKAIEALAKKHNLPLTDR